MQIQKSKPMTVQIMLIIIIIGLFAGMLSGLVGVGGGIIIVPALVYFLHYTQHQAQGTSLGLLTLPVVAVAFYKYYTDCKEMGVPIDFKVIGLIALGFLVGGYLGSMLALKLDKEILKKVFAVILFFTAIKMLNWDTAILNLFRSK
jgi:uncharacterized membrane protein YfcA